MVTQAVSKSILSKISDTTKELFTGGGFTWKEVFFTIMGVAALALASSAMIFEDGILVDVLAWTCVILGPSAAILQRKVGLLESLREITNELRNQVNQVSASNAALKQQNKRLEKNTKK